MPVLHQLFTVLSPHRAHLSEDGLTGKLYYLPVRGEMTHFVMNG